MSVAGKSAAPSLTPQLRGFYPNSSSLGQLHAFVLPRPARYQFGGGAEVPMLIEVHELEAHPVDFDEEIEPGAIDFGPDVRQSTDLKAAGRAQLVREHHGKHELINDIRRIESFFRKVEMAWGELFEPL